MKVHVEALRLKGFIGSIWGSTGFRVHQNWCTFLVESYNEDNSIWGSILGSSSIGRANPCAGSPLQEASQILRQIKGFGFTV